MSKAPYIVLTVMLLAVDVGNTNVVFALFSTPEEGGREIRARWRIATDPRRTGDEYAVWLLQLMKIEGIARESITQSIFGSVVPRAVHNLTVLAEKYFGLEPLIAGEGAAEWGIAIDVDDPRSPGFQVRPGTYDHAIMGRIQCGDIERRRTARDTQAATLSHRESVNSCMGSK